MKVNWTRLKHYNDFLINQFLATQESVQIFQTNFQNGGQVKEGN